MKKLLLSIAITIFGFILNAQEVPTSLLDRINAVNYILKEKYWNLNPILQITDNTLELQI